GRCRLGMCRARSEHTEDGEDGESSLHGGHHTGSWSRDKQCVSPGRSRPVQLPGLDDGRLSYHLDDSRERRSNGVTLNERWSVARLDRRAVPRVEYRRTAPALLELEGYRCAVRDLAGGGLRVEPAPAGRVWEDNQHVTGTLQLRTGERFAIAARI